MNEIQNKTERVRDPALKMIYCPNPSTTRGAPTILSSHPKEEKIIYCSGKLVVVRNLIDLTDSFVYKGHNDTTTVAKFSPNGYWVASGDVSGKVRIWSYDNPEHTLKLELPAFAGEVKDISWDPESKRIAVGGSGRGQLARVFMWDTGNSVGEIVGHQKTILSVDYKPTRPFRMITASEDFNVCVFEGPPFKFLQKLSGNHTNFVNCVRYSPDGSKAISCSSDKTIYLYDGKSGDVVSKFPESHEGAIYSICWNPDGTEILTASADKTIKQWNVEKMSVLITYSFNDNPGICDMQVAVVWTKNHMISLSLSGNLNFLDSSNPSKPKKVISGHQCSILALAVDCLNHIIYTGSYDGMVCGWKNHIAYQAKGYTNTAKIVSIACNNNNSMVSTGWDDMVHFGNFKEDSLIYHSNGVVGLNSQPSGIAKTLTYGVVSTSKEICLIFNEKIIFQTPQVLYTPTCIAISPNNQWVAVGSQEMKIYIYEIIQNSLQFISEINGHLGALTCLEFSPNGKMLAAGDAYREIRVWNIPDQSIKIQSLWVHHSTRVTCIAWDPESKYIASGSLDERIFIWNVESPMKKRKFEYTHKDGVNGIRFINSTTLISVGNDACINTWDLNIS